MSEQAPFEVVVEDDVLPRRQLRWIIAVTVLVVILCVVVVQLWLPPLKTVTGGGLKGEAPREISMIEQTLIFTDGSTRRLIGEQETQLQQYGWVEKDKGIVRIPIERAMQLMVEQAK
jgi:hypothetical protein